MLRRILFRLITFAAILVVTTLTLLYLLQDLLIFQTIKLDPGYSFVFDHPFEEHFITVPGSSASEAERLNALWFKTELPARGLLLYFHGNRGNLQRWGAFASDFTRHGYDVLMIDYRGYGKSSGNPSEEVLYADAERVLAWAKSRSAFSKLVIYGRSLGSAVASNLAAKVQPNLLILETPFDQLLGVVAPFWQPVARMFPLRSVFPNNTHLANVKSKRVIFHGTKDRIVPLRSALKLKPLLGPNDEFIIIPDGGHRNLRSFEAYRSKIAALLTDL